MKHLSKHVLSELREMLEVERRSLITTLTEHGQKIDGDWQGTAQGFVGAEPDNTDGADKMEELATNVPLVENLEARLKEVEAALLRMKDNTYGLTDGDEISLERLRANPAARTNV